MDLNLQTRLTSLLDKEDIRELVTQERYYRDSRQWEKLRACYHPDPSQTRVAVTWLDDTIDDFIAAAKQLADWGQNPFHSITPAVIHLRGDKAVVESKCVIRLRILAQGTDNEYEYTSYVRLVSRVQRLPGGEWKMRSLGTIYEQDSVVPAGMSIDGGSEEGLRLAHKVNGRRSSYKYLCWLLERLGFEVNRDLPGTDIPETVEREMNEHFAWLEA